MACNPRNVKPGTVYNNAHQHINVYGDDVEVDYRGYEVYPLQIMVSRVEAFLSHIGIYELMIKKGKAFYGLQVTVENFIRVLTGRHENSVSRTKRLLSDDRYTGTVKRLLSFGILTLEGCSAFIQIRIQY